MSYFILLLTNFRNQIKSYLKKKKKEEKKKRKKERKQPPKPKSRALGKDGAGIYSLFIMEDRVL